ncbi:hypothetical protein, partial [Desulfosarcina sp.]|uniref:hypothetical protein n=1 Tax=Desulfosarcina sp. TaxID=2027861 RepID=UPI003567176E
PRDTGGCDPEIPCWVKRTAPIRGFYCRVTVFLVILHRRRRHDAPDGLREYSMAKFGTPADEGAGIFTKRLTVFFN